VRAYDRRSRRRRRRLLVAGGVALLAIVVALAVREFPSGAETSDSANVSARVPHLPKALRRSTGRAYVVSTRGSDSNPGTTGRPFRSIQAALDRVRPGQRVLVRRGTYRENLELTHSGTARKPITIRSFPGERAVLLPGGGARCNDVLQLSDVSYVRVEGFRIQGANGCDNNTNVYVAGNSRHIEVSHNDIRNGQDHGLFTDPGTFDVQVLANRVHDNGTVGSGNKDHALYMEGTRHLVANNLIYDHPYGHAVQIYPSAKGTIITNNTIVNTSFTDGYRAAGVIVGGDGQGDTADDIFIANNIVAWNDLGLYGYYEDGSSGPAGSGNVGRRNLLYANRYGDLVNDRPVIGFRDNITDLDPRFVDRARNDFRLRSGSPAIDRALPQLAPRFDFAGHRRSGRPDLGALEFVKKRSQ